MVKFIRRDCIDIKSCLAVRLHGAVNDQCFGKTFPRLVNTIHLSSVPSGKFSKTLTRPKKKSDVFQALVFRLDAIEEAINGIERGLKGCMKDRDTLFLLYLFLDMHLPLVEAFKGEKHENLQELYPQPEYAISPLNTFDVSQELHHACFWTNKPSKVLDLRSLISKSLPNRSSARNLQPLFKRYFSLHKELFKAVLQAALLGNYRFCPNRLQFQMRAKVYSLSADDCVAVIDSNVQLAILSVKLCIIHEIRCSPSLRNVLLVGQWVGVESACIGLLRRREHTLSELLASFAKHKSKVKKYSRDAAFKIVAKKINASLAPRRSCDDFHMFYKLSTRVHAHDKTPFFILNAFGISNRTILTLESIARGTASTVRCSEECSQTIATFLEAFEVRFNVKIFDLPKHVADAQRDALVKRFELLPETSDEEIESYAPGMIFCARCRTFKGFLNNISDKRKKVRGYGSANVLMTERGLCCACSKSTKVVAAKPKGLIANLRTVKTKKRVSRTYFCEFTPLLRFASFGRVVQFYGEQYLLCPHCACFAKYRDMRWRAGMLNCEICAHRKKD